MPKKRFNAEQIVVLLRQIEVLMSRRRHSRNQRLPLGPRSYIPPMVALAFLESLG